MITKDFMAGCFGFYVNNNWDSIYKSYQSAIIGIEKYSGEDAELEIIVQRTFTTFGNTIVKIPTIGMWVCPKGFETTMKERKDTVRATIPYDWFENKIVTEIIEAITEAYFFTIEQENSNVA